VPPSLAREALVQSAAFLAVAAAILFGTAGSTDLWNFWAYLAVFAAVFIAALIVIDEDLIRERTRPGGARPPARLHLMTALVFVHLAVAGLDRGRFHWSDGVPPALVVVGLLLFALTNGTFLWSMRVNRYFSTAVRIQGDRGQTVVSAGPYALVRHPGYAAAFVMLPASGLALGSWLATGIALLGLPALLARTIGEDRMLRAELDGYEDYARRVRWRLVPGVW